MSNAPQLIRGIENARRAALSGVELFIPELWLEDSDGMASLLKLTFPVLSALEGVAVVVLVPWFVALFSCGKS